jgi:nitrite reductase/ring-hydroxylating ferredoxin subunit
LSNFVPAARVETMPPGARKIVMAGTREIALFNVDGRFYAIESTCPHQGGPMAEGWVAEGCVTCPWHAWTFELATGKMTLGDYATIDVFDVRVENGMVCVSSEPRKSDV